MHRITGVSDDIAEHEIEAYGYCAECGYTIVKRRKDKGRTRWRCLRGERNSRKSPHHGLTYDEMAKLREASGGCEICGRPKDLRIDHDHNTLAIRGVLCNYCNTGLYLVERNITWGAQAVKYLVQKGWKWD